MYPGVWFVESVGIPDARNRTSEQGYVRICFMHLLSYHDM